ncbi:hypothetical protein ACFFX0_13375 [Citricoccus parietis]|uniref:Uncharacterized protein n=1 Tax=Citricoccus parietis TaxID=592307 RepID=A0ABV5G0F5_9MICC
MDGAPEISGDLLMLLTCGSHRRLGLPSSSAGPGDDAGGPGCGGHVGSPSGVVPPSRKLSHK